MMDNLIWWGRARIAAFLDLVLTSVTLLIVIFATIFAGPEETWVSQPTWTLCILLIIVVICTFIQLWGAVKLLQGTDIGKDLPDALNAIHIWRNVSVIFILSQIGVIILSRTYLRLFIVVTYLIRVLPLYAMRKFKAEVCQRLRIVQVPAPGGITSNT